VARRGARQARAGTLPGSVSTRATFADACEEYLRFLEVDRQRKPSTLRDARATIRNARATIRNHLLPAFGDWRLETSAQKRSSAGPRVRPRPPAREPLEAEDHRDLPWPDGAGAPRVEASLEPR
jgi:hypothetical protein